MPARVQEASAAVPILWDDGDRYGQGRLLSIDEHRCVVACGDGPVPVREHVRLTPLLQGRDGLFELEGHVEDIAPSVASEVTEEPGVLVLHLRLRAAYDEVLLRLRQRLTEG